MNFRHPISVFVLLPLFLTGCLTETDDTQTSGPSSEAVGMYSGTTSSNRSIDGIIWLC